MGYVRTRRVRVRPRPRQLGCAKRLGDDVINAGGPGYMPGGEPPADLVPPQVTIPSPTPQQNANFFKLIDQSLTNEASTPPGVSASTLLQAASLPGAPAIVTQAAAQYRAANPMGSFFSQTVLGIPVTYLVGGLGLLLLVPLLKGRRR